MTTFDELLVAEMKALFSAERQWLKALPRIADAAAQDELKQRLRQQQEETKWQMGRLERDIATFDASPRGKACAAVRELIHEIDVILRTESDPPLRDARLIIGVQKVEHHQMCGYGTARMLAHVLGHDAVAASLQHILDEKVSADRTFTNVAVDIYTASGPAEPMAAVCDEPFRP